MITVQYQIILSGTKNSVETSLKILKLLGARSIIDLKVSAPFHCTLMKNATIFMKDALKIL